MSKDVWAAGNVYEPFMGRWSRLVANEFLSWLAVPAGGKWVDVGCGTGGLTSAVLSTAQPAQVISLDASAPYVSFARHQLPDARATFAVADARMLPLSAARADVVVSGLMLNFVAEPARAVAEMMRSTRPGGTVALYVWDYAGEMQFLRRFWDTARELDPRAAALDEGIRFPLCTLEALRALLGGAGLAQVEGRAIDVPTHFQNFDDFWAPFLGGQGPAPGYVMSLDAAERARLSDVLRSHLAPMAQDGAIDLIARAWAIRGIRP